MYRVIIIITIIITMQQQQQQLQNPTPKPPHTRQHPQQQPCNPLNHQQKYPKRLVYSSLDPKRTKNNNRNIQVQSSHMNRRSMGKSKEEDKDGRDIHYSNLKECINNINGNADNTDFNVTVTDGTNLDKNPPVGAVATLPQKQKKSKKNKNLINQRLLQAAKIYLNQPLPSMVSVQNTQNSQNQPSKTKSKSKDQKQIKQLSQLKELLHDRKLLNRSINSISNINKHENEDKLKDHEKDKDRDKDEISNFAKQFLYYSVQEKLQIANERAQYMPRYNHKQRYLQELKIKQQNQNQNQMRITQHHFPQHKNEDIQQQQAIKIQLYAQPQEQQQQQQQKQKQEQQQQQTHENNLKLNLTNIHRRQRSFKDRLQKMKEVQQESGKVGNISVRECYEVEEEGDDNVRNRYKQKDKQKQKAKEKAKKKYHRRDYSSLVQSYRQRYNLIQPNLEPYKTAKSIHQSLSNKQKQKPNSQFQPKHESYREVYPNNNIYNNCNYNQITRTQIKLKQKNRLKKIQEQCQKIMISHANKSLSNARRVYLRHQSQSQRYSSQSYNQQDITNYKNQPTISKQLNNNINRNSTLKPKDSIVNQPQILQTQTQQNQTHSSKNLIQPLYLSQNNKKHKHNPNFKQISARNIKGFVINQKQQLVSSILLKFGWKAFGEFSQKYTLKWTYNDNKKDYQLLRYNNNLSSSTPTNPHNNNPSTSLATKFMYFNHLNNNKLINKDQFDEVCQSLLQKGINIHQFIPETYIISRGSEYLEFVNSFQVRALAIGVKKHYQYFQIKKKKGKCGAYVQSNYRDHIQKSDLNVKIKQFITYILTITQQNIEQKLTKIQPPQQQQLQHQTQSQTQPQTSSDIPNFTPNSTPNFTPTPTIIVNLSILYNILILCCNLWISQQGQDSDQFDQKYANLCADSSVMAKIICFGKIDLLFEKYQQLRFSGDASTNSNVSGKKYSSHSKNIEKNHKKLTITNSYLKTSTPFHEPSQTLIQAIYLFNQYFTKNFSHQHIHKGGQKNLWIIKPTQGSKGRGIEIVDKIDKVAYYSETNSNKLVQKYIENIWILTQEIVERYQLLQKINSSTYSGESTNNLKQSTIKNLINKKFDLRQWVLLIPPYSYIFSQFYIRICSKQYKNEILTDLRIHLSNFTLNRQNFVKPEQSVLNQKQFRQILNTIGKIEQYYQLKQKINQRIRLLVDQALLDVEDIPGTFEIIGFDVLIDEEFNPWVIQCNMSPACNVRTQWLRQMKYQMTYGALQLVLDKQLLLSDNIQQPKEKTKKYKWNLLSKINPISQKQKDQLQCKDLQIYGAKMKIKKFMVSPTNTNTNINTNINTDVEYGTNTQDGSNRKLSIKNKNKRQKQKQKQRSSRYYEQIYKQC